MKTTKSTTTLVKNSRYRKMLILGAVLIALIFVGTYINKLQKYQKLATYPNQACVGIGVALKQGLTIGHYDFEARSILHEQFNDGDAQHKCTVGTVVTQETENYSEGYQLSSDVIYFNDSESAYNYANDDVNPEKSWGVDEEGQKNNIPQTSLFTFLHTEVEDPYFDAYTVRSNAVIYLTLPCNKFETDADANECKSMAEASLKEFADTVQNNLEITPIL